MRKADTGKANNANGKQGYRAHCKRVHNPASPAPSPAPCPLPCLLPPPGILHRSTASRARKGKLIQLSAAEVTGTIAARSASPVPSLPDTQTETDLGLSVGKLFAVSSRAEPTRHSPTTLAAKPVCFKLYGLCLAGVRSCHLSSDAAQTLRLMFLQSALELTLGLLP